MSIISAMKFQNVSYNKRGTLMEDIDEYTNTSACHCINYSIYNSSERYIYAPYTRYFMILNGSIKKHKPAWHLPFFCNNISNETYNNDGVFVK